MKSEKSAGCEITERSWVDFVINFKIEICLFAYIGYCLFQLLWLVIAEVPAFESIFEAMNVELPFATLLMMSLSDVCCEYWFILIPAGLGIVTNLGLFSVLLYKVKGIKIRKSIMETAPFLTLVMTCLFLSVLYKAATWSLMAPMMLMVNGVW